MIGTLLVCVPMIYFGIRVLRSAAAAGSMAVDVATFTSALGMVS